MDNFSVFQTFLDEFETPFLQVVSSMTGAASQLAATWFPSVLVLVVVLTGYRLMMGKGPMTSGQWVALMLKLGAVYWLVTDGTVYSQQLQPFFMHDLSAEITQKLSGAGGVDLSPVSSFDGLLQAAWRAGLTVSGRLGYTDIGEHLFVAAFWGCAVVSCSVAFAIWLVSHVLLGLTLIFYPFLLLFLLFEFLAPVFHRWLSVIFACILLQVLIVGLLTLILRVEGAMVARVVQYTGPNVYSQVRLLLMCCVGFVIALILAWQMKDLAATIAGGMHAHTGMLGLMLYSMSRSATGAVGGGFQAVNRGIDNLRGGGELPPPPGPVIGGGGGRGGAGAAAASSPWMAASGGYQTLSPAHKASAMRSYSVWAEENPKLAAKHGLQDYVSYVQEQQAKKWHGGRA